MAAFHAVAVAEPYVADGYAADEELLHGAGEGLGVVPPEVSALREGLAPYAEHVPDDSPYDVVFQRRLVFRFSDEGLFGHCSSVYGDQVAPLVAEGVAFVAFAFPQASGGGCPAACGFLKDEKPSLGWA